MTTEVWFRNPHNYIRELVELSPLATNIAWDRGALAKRKIDPNAHARLYFGEAVPWRLLAIGEQGAAEMDRDHTLANPKAVYPVWSYGEELDLLEDYLANPVGEDSDICNTPFVEADELPVLGQEHRVVVIGVPSGGLSIGKAFLRQLKELQEDYPKAIMHLHGPCSWRIAFGIGLASSDVDPRTPAGLGKVFLPSGKEVKYEKTFQLAKWIKILGMEPDVLKVPRNRCIYNIKSALWAGQHYDDLFNFRVNRTSRVVPDLDVPEADFSQPKLSVTQLKASGKPGDKYTCNTCSLMDECKYYRDGAVCAVPDAEPASLTSYFNTRDSGMILDGLAILLKSGVKRYERGLANEEVMGDLDKEVTKQQAAIFDQGVKLAKLIDPALRSPAGVQVNVGGGSQVQVNSGSPRQAIAAAMRELEARGVPREQITPDLIQGVFAGMKEPERNRNAIEGAVIENVE